MSGTPGSTFPPRRWRTSFPGAPAQPMPCIEETRARLAAWLDSPQTGGARRMIESGTSSPEWLASLLNGVMEDAGSAAGVVSAVQELRSRAGSTREDGSIERWLLVHQAAQLLDGSSFTRLGSVCCRLTCEEIASLLDDDDATRRMLAVSGIRFREFAKMVTGRRFSAGLFHWDIRGVRRGWLVKVPARDLVGFGRSLARMGGLGPVMFPHINPRRASPHLAEPAISASLAAMAETFERWAELRGFAAASWLRSPDTHRVSPRLAAVNAPIVAGGGFVTTVGHAPHDCGAFESSPTRAQLYRSGAFTPTIGLVLWPRRNMLRWWRTHPELMPAEAA